MEGIAISNKLLPFGSPFIALFSLAPIYIAFNRSRSYREVFWLMFIQAAVVHLISSYWLAFFRDFAIFTLGASAFGTGLEAGLCGIFFYIPVSLSSTATKLEENGGRKELSIPFRVLWFGLCWVLWEYIKSVKFLGYPWGTIFMASYQWKLIGQIASFTGVWGISFLFALVSAFTGEGIMLAGRIYSSQSPEKLLKIYRTTGTGLLWIFALVLVHGIWQYAMPRTPSKYFNAILVQHSQDTWEQDEMDTIKKSMELTEAEVNKLKENDTVPDIVVWSEGLLERSFPNSAAYYTKHPDGESLSSFISRMNVPFLIGGRTTVNKSKRHYSNSAMLFDKNGQYAGFYSKIHLVPFAEQIPLADSPVIKTVMKKIVGFSTGWTPGKQYVLFQIPISSSNPASTPLEYREEKFTEIALDEKGHANPETTRYFTANPDRNPDNFIKFSSPICFEDSFDDVCRTLYNQGSEVFINITNDSWSETAAAEYQHFIASSFRAIEYRTTLVRCCNSGYTVVVDPRGKILYDLPVFESTALSVHVPVYERQQTFYSRYGDWFAHLVLTLIGLYTVYAAFRINRKAEGKGRKHIVITFASENCQNADSKPVPEMLEMLDISDSTLTAEPAVKETEPSAEKPGKTEKTVKKEKPEASKTTSKSPAKPASKAKKTAKADEKASKPAAKPSSAKKAGKTASKTGKSKAESAVKAKKPVKTAKIVKTAKPEEKEKKALSSQKAKPSAKAAAKPSAKKSSKKTEK